MMMNKSSNLTEEILASLRSVVGDNPVSLHEPSFTGNESIYVKECLDSNFVSSVGKFCNRFEVDLAKFTGAKYAVVVVNGTAALHVALMLAGVKAGDEVLIPALTFVATANAVTYCGATPLFADAEERTLGLDGLKLREYLDRNTEQIAGQCVNTTTGKVIRAMVPMHTFGHPVDMESMLGIAHDFNIALVEDAAESLGSYYCGQHTGTFGLVGTLSFNGNKTITTGGGGAILTDDEGLARRAKHITTTAKVPHRWDYLHDEIGYNYRMPNLNAALGCAQLEDLPNKLAAKRELFNQYQAEFSKIAGVHLMQEPVHCRSNYWLQTLIIDSNFEYQRHAILTASNDAGYMTRPVWMPLSELSIFKGCPSMDLSYAQSISKRVINIPSSPSIVDSAL